MLIGKSSKNGYKWAIFHSYTKLPENVIIHYAS